ncbi:hemagglutinin repeat-containing protein [Litchfieldella xinjiangensis]|uniref:hemagglutinin repeat-containing protein n=1 Tax=Litchfieldella xinjiangensis TaxID=1166948 RepID=UPI0005BCE593
MNRIFARNNLLRAYRFLNRTATNTIVDQGTQVEAGGNLTQSARSIRDEAVSDQSWSSSDSQSHDVRVGGYAGAEAGASSDGTAEASAGVGVKASYDGAIESESESESSAVTSRFKAGGNISSSSEDETVLIGAQFEAVGDTTIEAGSLDFQAVQDTSSSRAVAMKSALSSKPARARLAFRQATTWPRRVKRPRRHAPAAFLRGQSDDSYARRCQLRRDGFGCGWRR